MARAPWARARFEMFKGSTAHAAVLQASSSPLPSLLKGEEEGEGEVAQC